MPERIAALLNVVRVLRAYGHHLANTVKLRAAAPGFGAIAACFGTINLSVILAHLHRGILRAVALERVLRARAARGRDIALARRRNRTHESVPAPADAATDQQPAKSVPCTAAPRPTRHPLRNGPADFHTPTLAELEQQVRRRPLGRTIVDICLDLAVVPGFCTGTFWNQLFDVMQCYGGSIAAMTRERRRREQSYHQEQDRISTPSGQWPDLRRQMLRQVLGFFIGEEPILPFRPSGPIALAREAATGPP
jgi:hypothetical protein